MAALISLDFFIEQQRKLSQLKYDSMSLEAMREHTSLSLASQPRRVRWAQFIERAEGLLRLPFEVSDEEFAPLFYRQGEKKKQGDRQSSSDGKAFSSAACGKVIFTSPLSDQWQSSLLRKSVLDFYIRAGFYQSEWDIYETVMLGFDGLLMYASGLDVFQMQYLTEIARDYQLSLFFILHSKEELKQALETDAPYFVLSAFSPKNFSYDPAFLVKTIPHIPKTASLLAFGSGELQKKQEIFTQMGYSGLILTSDFPCSP
jgi:hypothetical protein